MARRYNHAGVPDPYFSRWLDEVNGVYKSTRRPHTASSARLTNDSGLVSRLAPPVAVVTAPFAGRATFRRASERESRAGPAHGVPVWTDVTAPAIARAIPRHVSHKALMASIHMHSLSIPTWQPE